MEILLGFSAVSIFSVIYWIAVYPRQLSEAVTFRLDDSMGTVVSLLTWFMIAGVVNGIYWVLINA